MKSVVSFYTNISVFFRMILFLGFFGLGKFIFFLVLVGKFDSSLKVNIIWLWYNFLFKLIKYIIF